MIDHAEIRHRVAALRLLLTKEELDGFIIPRSDMHQGEEVPDSEERLAYISGFTGSAGEAIVTKDTAALFVDGRYTLQADQQTPVDTFDHQSLVDNPLTVWLKSNVKKGQKIALVNSLGISSRVNDRTVEVRSQAKSVVVAFVFCHYAHTMCFGGFPL